MTDEREVDEALDRGRAPVSDDGMGLADVGELTPDRDEAVMNPLDDEDADADTMPDR
jgi:hypothetical protein